MSKQKNPYLDRFLNPSGVSLLLSLVLLGVNAYASSQLLPLIRNIDSLNSRVESLEERISNQELVIIPKGELDAKFHGIETQLDDIKEVLRERR